MKAIVAQQYNVSATVVGSIRAQGINYVNLKLNYLIALIDYI